ncbi:hypothetical protein MSPP1_003055 [Malassezia sp. CBS 17886]|nr:hypothetical protein MSPP1_003055 [Malassezia sp. CBS 17886]
MDGPQRSSVDARASFTGLPHAAASGDAAATKTQVARDAPSPTRTPPSPPRERERRSVRRQQNASDDASSERARRARTTADARQLNAELTQLERQIRNTHCADAAAAADLARDQRRFMDSSFALLELLQYENRHAHARQLPEIHTVLTRTRKTGIEYALAAMHGAAAALTDLLVGMLCSTYALCAWMYETSSELRVRRACLEWLGHMACRHMSLLQLQHAASADAAGGPSTPSPRAPPLCARDTDSRGRTSCRDAARERASCENHARGRTSCQDAARGRTPCEDHAHARPGGAVDVRANARDACALDAALRAVQTAQAAHAAQAPAVARSEYEAWRAAAAHWFGLATREMPNEARLYLPLAQIAEGDDLRACYFLCKSVQVAHGQGAAQERFTRFFDARAQSHRVRAEASFQELLVYLHGTLWLRSDTEGFQSALERICMHLQPIDNAAADRSLRIEGTRYAHSLLETDWMMTAVCATASMLDYARPGAFVDAHLLAACRTSSAGRWSADTSLARVTRFLRARGAAPAHRAGAPEDVDAHLVATEWVPPHVARALRLLVPLVHFAASAQHEAVVLESASINSPTVFLVLVLLFLQVLSLHAERDAAVAAMCELVRDTFPWDVLLSHARSNVFEMGSLRAEDLLDLARQPLPEDWCLRGMQWNVSVSSVAQLDAACESHSPHVASLFVFASEQAMLTDLGAQSLFFATAKSQAHMAASMARPDLQHVLHARHARFVVLLALVYEQLGVGGGAAAGAGGGAAAGAGGGGDERDVG